MSIGGCHKARTRGWLASPTLCDLSCVGKPMSDQNDLNAQFLQAVAESKQLPDKPDNMTLLKIYALYKQASSGDVTGERPGFADFVGRAKYDAWAGLQGLATDVAQQRYIDLIESLK